MLVTRFVLFLGWAMRLLHVAASLVPSNANLHIRNAPGTTPEDTLRSLGRALSSAVKFKRDQKAVYKNTTSVAKTWDGAILFQYDTTNSRGNVPATADMKIICKTCYVKGSATAQFTIDSNFNASKAIANITSQVETEVVNTTTAIIDYLTESLPKTIANISTTDLFNIDAYDIPRIPFDFDIDLPDIPECQLQFQFDALELYMQTSTVFSGSITYTLNLFTSQTEIGVKAAENLLIGVVFTVDLILSANAAIDISSGFHIRLEKAVIELPMFSKNVSKIKHEGGHFEFLPIQIESAGVILSAILRIGARAGIKFSSSPLPSLKVAGKDLGKGVISAGVETGAWINVAELVTNITAVPADNDCKLHVVEELTMAVGAQAGATVGLGSRNWGPAADTSVPIWYTTLGSVCAVSEPAVTPASSVIASAIKQRADLTTTTISTEFTYVATGCVSPELINCPQSLQIVSKYSREVSITTSVPSGSKATFPASTQNTVLATVSFGTNAKLVSASSGEPVLYTPTISQARPGSSTPGSGASQILEKKTRGVSNKVIIGVCVGLGFPVLIASLLGCLFLLKQKREAAGK
ncbi:hypothetical protein BJ875DRAFT_518013 [Amylocarpus encephaloides]|uniref:Mid2 domain-containing protein n=1 Tax=Amylocarpus encephaloides TaxID=45428 RepID=A0A9P8C8R2_9HELO|nr:hypothetical protein BJ875DRAFT_518013 [Amylocarpus encephaloides]